MNYRATKLHLAFAAAMTSIIVSADVGDVRLKGWLGDRLDAMIERHIAAMDVDYITAPFLEKTERGFAWQSEFWGKWMHSSVPYLRYVTAGKSRISEGLRAKIERGVDRMLSSQEPCGYIGNYPDDLRLGEGWDVWGIKYTMMGLMHYYDFVEKEVKGEGKGEGKERCDRVLLALRGLCDYVIAEIGPGGRRGRELWQTGNWSGYASSSILEPVVWLYKRIRLRQDLGGEAAAQKYLDFATYIVKGMTEPEKGPRLVDLALKGVSVADRNEPDYDKNRGWSYVCKNGRSKAYEMMSCYQGLLEYCEAVKMCKGENVPSKVPSAEDIFKAAVMTAEDIVKEEVNLAGGCASSEAWFHGASKQHKSYMRLQETCVTTTWMRLCEKLLAMTGDPKWADQLEKTFYNAYLAAMRPDGSEFAGYTPLAGCRWHGQHHCRMHIDCCNANGPRGFLCFLNNLFRVKDGVAIFDFYASALAKARLGDGREVAFDMYSLYPRGNTAHIISHTEGAGAFPVRLRIPGWCRKATVRLNGKELDGVKSGEYFEIVREWRLGDRVDVWFDMPTVAHVLNEHVAFTRGPVLLARDSRFCDGDMSEPIFRRPRDGESMPVFSAVRTPSDDIWMAFAAALPIGSHDANPEGCLPTSVSFCDYASAANTWRSGDSCRTWFPILLGPAE